MSDVAPVPQFDLGAQHAALADEIRMRLQEVVASGRFVLGAQLEAFEVEVSAFLGVEHAIGCNSGTDALELALGALGVGPGDEVITTPFTFIATAEAILHVGARPVFVDIEPDGYTLDPRRVEAAVSQRTRAILPVHLFGQPAAMQPLLDIARRHRLHVVEDCAQSFGARCDGQSTGAIGNAGCFSFYPTKNLGALGDGGLITTGSAALAGKLRLLRNHGGTRRHEHTVLGWNSRLDELQAAVLRAKLKRVESFNARRRRIAQRYSAAFAGLPGLHIPEQRSGTTHVFHQYTLLAERRNAVVAALAARGVGSAIHYPHPLHQQPAMSACRVADPLDVAGHVASRCLSLPMFPELDDGQVERVIAALVESVGPGRGEPEP